MRPVPSHKKIIFFAAIIVAALAVSATTTDAQGHHSSGHPARVVVAAGGYYTPAPFFYADPWYGFQYPGPYGYPPPYVYYGYADASVHFEVTPRQAEVYVDGYYAGVVDDFDGTFQRLRVEPGEHEIELYLEGHRTVRQKVYLAQDKTFRVKYEMERLAAGQPPEPKPQP